ncbi:MAG: ATP-binding cassette domain-containing protein [Angelakisella sp.]
MIKATNLVKSFDDFTALDGLCTEITGGCIYGLVGPNGSGKSTLMRLMSGIYQPDGGSLVIDDEPVFENIKVKDRVFYLSDDIFFLPKATTDDMADFYEGIYSTFSREKYETLKKFFPIDCKKRINNFSKGMRRQSALLTALACNTDYLLMDEAFDGLDPVIRLMIKKLLAEEIANRGITVIITSHNLRELEDLCDQIGLIHKGKLLLEKDLDELKFGFCKVQAVYSTDVDWAATGLNILQKNQRGSVTSLLVRGTADDTLETLQSLDPIFCEVVSLTLEEVFIGEMEAVGYDYNNLIL